MCDMVYHPRPFGSQDFITPLIGAIFQGSNFQELSFEINSSRFRYGEPSTSVESKLIARMHTGPNPPQIKLHQPSTRGLLHW